jgi:hypothetical protein
MQLWMRREDPKHDPASPDVPDPGAPLDAPRGAEPGPDPDAPHEPPVPDTTPVLS